MEAIEAKLDWILPHKEALAKIIVCVEDLKVQMEKAKLEASDSVLRPLKAWLPN